MKSEESKTGSHFAVGAGKTKLMKKNKLPQKKCYYLRHNIILWVAYCAALIAAISA